MSLRQLWETLVNRPLDTHIMSNSPWISICVVYTLKREIETISRVIFFNRAFELFPNPLTVPANSLPKLSVDSFFLISHNALFDYCQCPPSLLYRPFKHFSFSTERVGWSATTACKSTRTYAKAWLRTICALIPLLSVFELWNMQITTVDRGFLGFECAQGMAFFLTCFFLSW